MTQIRSDAHRGPLNFVQRRSRSEILALAAALEANNEDHTRESKAMAAGKRIKSGDREVADLLAIAAWKSPRRQALILENSAELVAEALEMACKVKSERLAVVALSALSGVGLPMASAIMTCVNPGRYTVIDVRALDALGERGRGITASIYEHYLKFCRHESARLDVSLRTLDRALWQAGSPW
jgi:hypothetical protein